MPEENLVDHLRRERERQRDLEEAIGAASQANIGDDTLLVRRREVDERDVAVRRHLGQPWPVGLRPDIALREDIALLDGGQKLGSHRTARDQRMLNFRKIGEALTHGEGKGGYAGSAWRPRVDVRSGRGRTRLIKC